MLYGDTLTLIKQKITNIVVFESICSRPKGVCLSGVMSEWGFVQWGYVRLPHAIAGIGIAITIKIKIVSWSRGW